MSYVKGIEKRTITIEVPDEQLLLSLADTFNVKSQIRCILYPNSSKIWMEEKKNGVLVSLMEYEDISYHGSQNYKYTGNLVNDPIQISAYESLKTLALLMKTKIGGENNDR